MPGRGRPTVVLNLLTCHVHDLAWHPSIRYGHGYPLILRLGVGGIALTVAPAVAREVGQRYTQRVGVPLLLEGALPIGAVVPSLHRGLHVPELGFSAVR